MLPDIPEPASGACRKPPVSEEIGLLLDRIVEAGSGTVTAACETRIAGPERDRHIVVEKRAGKGKPGRGLEGLFELSMNLLANPRKFWNSDRIEHRRTLPGPAFADPLHHNREKGFSNP